MLKIQYYKQKYKQIPKTIEQFEKAPNESGYRKTNTIQPERTPDRNTESTTEHGSTRPTTKTHFLKQDKLDKIFKRNAVKVSYSCTKNIKSIVQSHNKNILHKAEDNANWKLCSCRVAEPKLKNATPTTNHIIVVFLYL